MFQIVVEMGWTAHQYTYKFINFINILQKHFQQIVSLENQGLDLLAFVKAIMQSKPFKLGQAENE